MRRDFKFKKGRLLLSILVSFLLILASFSFLLKPQFYVRNVFMKSEYIQTIGLIGIPFFLTFLYSKLRIFNRELALQVTKDFLLDNSKYESFGKIDWKDIYKIERLKNESIELFINKSVFENRKLNLLKKILLFMQNWNYKKSLIISSTFLDCNIEELFETITLAYKNYK